MSQIVLFGTGGFAEVAHYLFTHDSEHEVVAYSVHRSHLKQTSLSGVPIVPFEEIGERYPPDSHGLFVAAGYRDVNRFRADIYREAKGMGYRMVNYVSSKCTNWAQSIGDNCFIFEDNTLQPFVRIGNNVVLWSGNHIGHHSVIEDHCFITSHVVISGHVRVGAYSFVGVNATLRDSISIGESNVIGAAAVIMKDTQDREVYVEPRTKPDSRKSDELNF